MTETQAACCGDDTCTVTETCSHILHKHQPSREGALLVGAQAQVLCDGVQHLAVAS